MKRRGKIIPKKKLTLEIVLEKLDDVIQRLDIIEKDLKELKGIAYPKIEEEKEPTPEFFMEK
jgi:signal recognition particle subunit SEC65